MYIKNFATTKECYEMMELFAKERGLKISFHFFLDNLASLKYFPYKKEADGTLTDNHLFEDLKFGLTEHSLKVLQNTATYFGNMDFYAKKKGMSLIYRFSFVKETAKEEMKKFVALDRSHFYGYLNRLLKPTNLGLSSIDFKDRETKEVVTTYEYATDLPNTLYYVYQTDAARLLQKHELNFYLPEFDGYLNLRFKLKTLATTK